MEKNKEKTGKIIGRLEELDTLKQILNSKKSEFLAVYGRRRVGKTYMIRNFFAQASCTFFHSTGIQKGNTKKQLEQFSKQIGNAFYGGASIKTKTSWMDAFEELTKAMQQAPEDKPIVLFMDEFPWMAKKHSKIMQALEYYWNRYWDHDPRVKLIICGSSASWVIENIINNKGGLYNRVTRTMRLIPFNLNETKEFLSSRGIRLNQRQVLDLYMVFGGIPHYLALLPLGHSAHQCIDTLCFRHAGSLIDEFEKLFASLFKNADSYMHIVRIIAKHRYGINQAELMKQLSKGGRAAKKLQQLEEAGFIHSFLPHKREQKGVYYKIFDEFVLFYLHWIAPSLRTIRKQTSGYGFWLAKMRSPAWKSWAGYTFETICHKHIPQIKKALKIDPGAEVGSWRYVSKASRSPGAQIDMLFDRYDNAITIAEIKHSDRPFVVDKKYAQELLLRNEIYQKKTRTQKQLFLVIISSSGLKPSKHAEIIDQTVTLSDLFSA